MAKKAARRQRSQKPAAGTGTKKNYRATSAGKSAARTGAGLTPNRGSKRKREPGKSKADDAPDGSDKKGKILTGKQKRRKQVTKLYAELINPTRTRKGDEVVNDILVLLGKLSASSLAQYCSKDIGSRVLQACLKWGSRSQRKRVFSVLQDDIPKMCVDRYGHVVVLKLLRYISRTSLERKPSEKEKKERTENMKEFLEAFHGKNLHTAFFQRHGCRVINAIYFSDAVSTKEKRRLLYDIAIPPAIALTRPESAGSKTLRQILHAADLTQDQRNATMDHLREALERSVDKELLGIDVVHLLFQAFCEDASESQLKDLAAKCMAGAPYLLSTKPGAEAVLRLLGVATAKERKEFCRELKGKFPALATNGVDYLVMIRLATTVDDTVLLKKTMLAEWLGELEDMCFDKYGHRVLSWIFRPDDPHLFSPYERASLALPAPSSLKKPETRQQELLQELRTPLRNILVNAPLKAAADINAKSVLTAYLSADWDAELVEALVAAAEQEAEKEEDFGLLSDGTCTTTILVLLRIEPEGAEPGLAQPLWKRCFKPRLEEAATSRCAFVLLALLKNGAISAAVKTVIRGKRRELEAAANAAEAAGKVAKGARKLLEAVEEEPKA
mmetsp:Transcript_73243/g.145268  ORF Transcript_73243/g.145268 Transcript_73243/m.145268 type:complete len:615 (+) Transcript_73243:68-1912(+)